MLSPGVLVGLELFKSLFRTLELLTKSVAWIRAVQLPSLCVRKGRNLNRFWSALVLGVQLVVLGLSSHTPRRLGDPDL